MHSSILLTFLFSKQFLDTSTEFLYGESLNSLGDPENAEVAWAMVQVLRGVRLRLQLNRFLFLYRDKEWFNAVARVHEFVDGHIDKALQEQKSRKSADTGSITATESQRSDLLWDMAKNLKDKKALRSQILAVFIPSNDTTSIFISNIFYALARNPDVWAKLREEVTSLGSAPLTFELLRGMKYLNWVLNESKQR